MESLKSIKKFVSRHNSPSWFSPLPHQIQYFSALKRIDHESIMDTLPPKNFFLWPSRLWGIEAGNHENDVIRVIYFRGGSFVKESNARLNSFLDMAISKCSKCREIIEGGSLENKLLFMHSLMFLQKYVMCT